METVHRALGMFSVYNNNSQSHRHCYISKMTATTLPPSMVTYFIEFTRYRKCLLPYHGLRNYLGSECPVSSFHSPDCVLCEYEFGHSIFDKICSRYSLLCRFAEHIFWKSMSYSTDLKGLDRSIRATNCTIQNPTSIVEFWCLHCNSLFTMFMWPRTQCSLFTVHISHVYRFHLSHFRCFLIVLIAINNRL